MAWAWRKSLWPRRGYDLGSNKRPRPRLTEPGTFCLQLDLLDLGHEPAAPRQGQQQGHRHVLHHGPLAVDRQLGQEGVVGHLVHERLERGKLLVGLGGEKYRAPADEPLTLVSYEAATAVRAYIESLGAGGVLTPRPLYLEPRGYVLVPLEETYTTAFAAMPRYWREALEKK